MAETPSAPPNAEDFLNTIRLDGFYKDAYELLEKRMAAEWIELRDTRAALVAERERVVGMEREIEGWRDLAYQFGTETIAERRARTNDLHGTIVIAARLLANGDDRAIAHACMDLARKMQFRARTPGGER